jgi:hypothetical protein
MVDDEWLKTLKEGDDIFVGSSGWNHEYYAPDTVKRITKTMIVLTKSTTRFRLDGTEIGEHRWGGSASLFPDNERMRERIWMLAAINKLSSLVLGLNTYIDYRALTHEQLERIIPQLAKIKEELIPPKGITQK